MLMPSLVMSEPSFLPTPSCQSTGTAERSVRLAGEEATSGFLQSCSFEASCPSPPAAGGAELGHPPRLASLD